MWMAFISITNGRTIIWFDQLNAWIKRLKKNFPWISTLESMCSVEIVLVKIINIK